MDRRELNRLLVKIDELIASTSYECLEVEWELQNKILRIYIDSSEGIHFNDCANVTDILGDLENLEVNLPEEWHLEVSSPGVERPIRRKSHFERHVGKTVKVRLLKKVLDRKNGIGKVVEVSGDDCVTLETTSGLWKFPLDTLDKAKLVYDWGSNRL